MKTLCRGQRCELRALPNQVIVQPIQRSRRHLEIVPAKEQPCAEGKVIAVGDTRRKSGERIPPPIFKGAWVTFRPFAGTDFEWEGKKLKRLNHADLETTFSG